MRAASAMPRNTSDARRVNVAAASGLEPAYHDGISNSFLAHLCRKRMDRTPCMIAPKMPAAPMKTPHVPFGSVSSTVAGSSGSAQSALVTAIARIAEIKCAVASTSRVLVISRGEMWINSSKALASSVLIALFYRADLCGTGCKSA